jgi:hypothetical protein
MNHPKDFHDNTASAVGAAWAICICVVVAAIWLLS